MVLNFVLKNRFYDSVLLMQIASQAKEQSGVEKVSVLMGTASNKALMKETSILAEGGEQAGPNDLVIAVVADQEEACSGAFEKVLELLEKREVKKSDTSYAPRTIARALDEIGGANIALISLPGPFVRHEAQKALQAGLNLMIFSDNVPLADEIALKQMAHDRGLLVMGPDCGTAIIKGKALGFANVVRPGPVGIVGASGTGIQEITVLLEQQGIGISHAIGTGSKDLSQEVDAITMLDGMSVLQHDRGTSVIVLVSKPPDRKVAAKVVKAAKKLGKPVVICFIRGEGEKVSGNRIESASTLEETVGKTAAIVTGKPLNQSPFQEDFEKIQKKSEGAAKALPEERVFIRGLYSGGTLCEEALVILHELLGEVYSNTNVYPPQKLEDARKSQAHTLVDLGDDEFTRGTPHPMIDYTLRKERLMEEAAREDVAVILMDVVLGYGSHADPAGELLPLILKVKEREGAPVFVISLCGTEGDPQNLRRQKSIFEEAGVFVLPSNAQAARFAALVASRGRASEKLLQAT
ncbi:MAG: acyl-CoA synthetase FdrA [Candidatus Eremiobacteraeota bacterium]|nr:acyl-CoA synthetase FdrA [Candidatus Eremiobacteraeota bacterium]